MSNDWTEIATSLTDADKRWIERKLNTGENDRIILREKLQAAEKKIETLFQIVNSGGLSNKTIAVGGSTLIALAVAAQEALGMLTR